VFADLAEKHGCLTAVGFQRRHVPAMTALRKRVEERGPIHTVRLDFVKSTRRTDQHAGYYDGAIDPLTSDGIHAVDNLRWLAGGDVETVTSSIRQLAVPGPFPNTVLAQVTFSSGAVGQLHFGYMTGRRIFRAEIHGPNITAYVDPDRESYIVADDGEPEVRPSSDYGKELGGVLADGEAPRPNPNPQPQHWLGFWHEHRHFIDCIKDGRQPSSNFRDAVKTMELVDRIYAGR
jgi:predicted dehydrogenase